MSAKLAPIAGTPPKRRPKIPTQTLPTKGAPPSSACPTTRSRPRSRLDGRASQMTPTGRIRHLKRSSLMGCTAKMASHLQSQVKMKHSSMATTANAQRSTKFSTTGCSSRHLTNVILRTTRSGARYTTTPLNGRVAMNWRNSQHSRPPASAVWMEKQGSARTSSALSSSKRLLQRSRIFISSLNVTPMIAATTEP